MRVPDWSASEWQQQPISDDELIRALRRVSFSAALGDEGFIRLYASNAVTGTVIFVEDIAAGERSLHLD